MNKRFLAVALSLVLVMSGIIYFAPQPVSAATKSSEGIELPTVCLNHGNKCCTNTPSEDTLKSAATCKSPAVYYKVCYYCEKIVETKTYTYGTKLPHDYCCVGDMIRDESTLVSEATYESPAVYYKTCTLCGYVNVNETYEWGDPLILYGDANDDGYVDDLDMLLLTQYWAEYDFDTESSSVELPNELYADANADGYVDDLDMLLLTQYWAEYDFDTETSTVVLGPVE